MKTLTIYIILLLALPSILEAQYIGGIGNGDASISLTNAHISVNKIETELPAKYELYQNYPNPFNPNTIIRFQIKGPEFVSLKVYDILGKVVSILVNEKLQAGTYETQFSINSITNYNVASSVYFYKLETNGLSETKIMLFIK